MHYVRNNFGSVFFLPRSQISLAIVVWPKRENITFLCDSCPVFFSFYSIFL